MKEMSKINSKIPNIYFNKSKGNFFLRKSNSLSKIDDIISDFVSKFENSKKIKKNYKKLKIGDIEFHKYDDTMLQYCFEVLDKKMSNNQTKWIRKYSNLNCLGTISKKIYFNEKKILNFFKKNKLSHLKENLIRDFKKNKRKNFLLNSGWLFFNNKDEFKIKKRIKDFLEIILLTKNYYRVIKIVESIKRTGWEIDKSWYPHGSVLYLYKKKYMILTGRHRLVALKYCYIKGYVDNISLQFPVLQGHNKIRNLNYNI